MQSRMKSFRKLGIILFSTGVLVGMPLFVMMNWAYFEAYYFFGATAPADKNLPSLRCPLVLTNTEPGAITASISNNSDRDLDILIRTEISYYGAATAERTTHHLAAGETRKLSWSVTSDDMVFGHLILARVFVYGAYTLPSHSSTCGTVMVNVPGLKGIQLFVIALILSLGSMAAGWSLWLTGSRPVQPEGMVTLRAMVILTQVILLGIIAGIFGLWGLGLICAVVSVVLIYTVVGHSIQKA